MITLLAMGALAAYFAVFYSAARWGGIAAQMFICATVLAGLAAFGLGLHFLVYGISRDFGDGIGVGFALAAVAFYIAWRVDHQRSKQEIMPPQKTPKRY